MDVSNPSNFVRILEIFKDFDNLKKNMSSYSFNDTETLDLIKKVYDSKRYVIDPHGAVGLLGLNKYLKINSKNIGIFLETAHPIKFSDNIEKCLKIKLDVPKRINKILSKEKKFIEIDNYDNFKNTLLNFR